ncbi:MAG: bacteriohopanetetrol glucosamine biosynthesis glycosyltransferase HpnI [Stellaceae bacterium]
MSPTIALLVIIVPAWASLVAATICALRFARQPLPAVAEQPPISVLKPLHGAEPGLYQNLRSFAEQDYPAVQLVLGVNDPADGAVPVVAGLRRDLPQADVALVVDSRVHGENRKVSNLENMLPAARHGILVLADSDMRVDRGYLRAVAAPLGDAHTGIVTCLYRGVSTGGIWSDLGALHINFGFLPSALLAAALGLGGGCFGATIALRREILDRIGGLARVHDELADDHRLGEAVQAQGLAVVLSRYLVDAQVSEPSFAGLWRHELRWARTVRSITPLGFAGSFFAQPAAIAALGVAASGLRLTPCIVLAITLALRWASAWVIAGALRIPVLGLWLLPARDALSFAVFVASFFGRTVFWRDQHFRVEPSGRMTVEEDKAHEDKAHGDEAL